MASSTNQSFPTTPTLSQNLSKTTLLPSKSYAFAKVPTFKKNVQAHKPLYISAVAGFSYISEPENSSKTRESSIQCNAYDWWALNVVLNIYNKKVLNVFPFPWLTSTLSIAAGSLLMLFSWATWIAEAPQTDHEYLKTLLHVVVAHTIGHVAATVSMSKVAISFTHIIKGGESAFSVEGVEGKRFGDI